MKLSQLKENKEKFETIFNQDKTIKLIIDPTTGRIVDANPAAQDFYGYSYQQLTAKKIQEINQLSQAEVEAEMKRAKEQEQDFFNFRHQVASGAIKHVEVYSNPITIRGEKLLISSIHDITERKKAQQKLKETKQLYNNVINTQQEMICRFKADTTLIFVNQAYCNYFAKSESELLGTKFLEFIPQEEQATILDHLESLAKGGEAVTYEHQVRTPQGEKAWQRWTDYPIFNDEGEVIEYQSIGLDITERKQRERQLKLLSEMVEQSDDSIIQTDTKGKIEYANQAAEELFGWPREELYGKHPDIFNAEENSKQIQREIYQTLAAGESYSGEILNCRCDGSKFWCQVKIIPLRDENEEIYAYMGIQRDISARKEREKKLREAKRKAEVANQAKSDFIANMSHEIRTPLNSIVGFSELLLESETDKTKKDKLSTIVNSGQHLKAIIDDILDFSRIEAGEVELEIVQFSLSQVLKDIKQMFSVRVKNLDFELTIDSGVPQQVRGDKYRVNQIIINLVSNAFKFTSEGKISLECKYKKGRIVITVSDTGIGIPDQKQEQIFSAFKQGDSSITRKYGGTGLGLAIVKRLVELMEGTISFESEVGQGTTFRVELPLEIAGWQQNIEEKNQSQVKPVKEMITRWIDADPEIEDLTRQAVQKLPEKVANIAKAVASADKEKIETAAHSLKGLAANFNMEEIYRVSAEITDLARSDNFNRAKIEELVEELEEIVASIPPQHLKDDVWEEEGKILLAEDEELNQLLIREVLNDIAVKIDTVSDGKQALEQLTKEDYDLLLLDIQMPIMGGLEVMQELKKQEIDLPVVALTASVQKQVKQRCLELGCKDYLTKPLNQDKLRNLIQSEIKHL